jgi:hypothetical protein
MAYVNGTGTGTGQSLYKGFVPVRPGTRRDNVAICPALSRWQTVALLQAKITSIRVSLASFPAFEPFALGPAAPSAASGGECGGEGLESRRTLPFLCGSLVR